MSDRASIEQSSETSEPTSEEQTEKSTSNKRVNVGRSHRTFPGKDTKLSENEWEELSAQCVMLLEELTTITPEKMKADTAGIEDGERVNVNDFLELVKEKEALSRRSEQMEKDIISKNEHIIEGNKVIVELQTEIAKMLRELTTSTTKIDQMRQQQARIDELVTQVNEGKAEFQKTLGMRNEIESAHDETSAAVTIAKLMGRSLEQKIAEKTQEIRTLQRQKEDMQQKFKDVKRMTEGRITDMKHNNDQTKAQLDRANTKFDMITRTEKSLTVQLAKSKEHIISLMHKIALRDAERARTVREERQRVALSVLTQSTGTVDEYPTGNVTFVFTDVQQSSRLWEECPQAMMEALSLHNNICREKIKLTGGYEVRTEGDSFFIVFRTVLSAVWCCVFIQQALLSANWPRELLENKNCREEYDNEGTVIFRGLRVRMGIHCGQVLTDAHKLSQAQNFSPTYVPTYASVDPGSRRADYHGSVVRDAARVAARANGGQVLATGTTFAAVAAEVGRGVDAKVVGLISVFGNDSFEFTDSLVQILPRELEPRSLIFSTVNTTTDNENTKVSSLAGKYTQEHESGNANATSERLKNILADIDIALKTPEEIEKERILALEKQKEEEKRMQLQLLNQQIAFVQNQVDRQRTINEKAINQKALAEKELQELLVKMEKAKAETIILSEVLSEYESKSAINVKLSSAYTLCEVIKNALYEVTANQFQTENEEYEKTITSAKQLRQQLIGENKLLSEKGKREIVAQELNNLKKLTEFKEKQNEEMEKDIDAYTVMCADIEELLDKLIAEEFGTTYKEPSRDSNDSKRETRTTYDSFQKTKEGRTYFTQSLAISPSFAAASVGAKLTENKEELNKMVARRIAEIESNEKQLPTRSSESNLSKMLQKTKRQSVKGHKSLRLQQGIQGMKRKSKLLKSELKDVSATYENAQKAIKGVIDEQKERNARIEIQTEHLEEIAKENFTK